MEFIETFSYVIKYKQGKENIIANALSRRNIHLNTLNTKLLGFEYMKELYLDDTDFGEIYFQCELATANRFFRHDEFLLKDKRLCVTNWSMHELLVREAHGGGLMRYFKTTKILEVLHDHFYWPNMKRDVQRICDKCITCKQAKSKVKSHGLYTPSLVPKEPWVNISIDFILDLPRSRKGRDSIFVVVDRFSKMTYFISS